MALIIYVWIVHFHLFSLSLFWAITTDIFKQDSAIISYPFIFMLGYLGSSLIPLVIKVQGHSSQLIAIGILLVLVATIFWLFVNNISQELCEGYRIKCEKEVREKDRYIGFFRGFILTFTNRYLLGIFFIFCSEKLIVKIANNCFKYYAVGFFSEKVLISRFLSDYAVYIGIVSFFLVLLNANYKVQKVAGLRGGFLFFPLFILIVLLAMKFNFVFLGNIFWGIVFVNGINGSIIQPMLKQLYIPTTKDSSYKSRIWIEFFGSLLVNKIITTTNDYRERFIDFYGYLNGMDIFLKMIITVIFIITCFWFYVIFSLTNQYNITIKENKLIDAT